MKMLFLCTEDPETVEFVMLQITNYDNVDMVGPLYIDLTKTLETDIAQKDKLPFITQGF